MTQTPVNRNNCHKMMKCSDYPDHRAAPVVRIIKSLFYRFSSLYLLIGLAGLSLFLTRCVQETSGKPNIIFIMADDLGYGDLGCYGQQKFSTPHIDRLADEGMRFTSFYAGSTVCAPSRSALMSGFHTGHTAVRGNKEIKPEGQYPIPDSVNTVAEFLKKAGYITAAIGKWGLGPVGSSGDPVKQGFDYFFGYNCQREAHHYYPDHLWRNDERINFPDNPEDHTTYSHFLLTSEALEFIRRAEGQPFFLYLPYTIPHASMEIPDSLLDPFIGRYEETPYIGTHYASQEMPNAAFAAMVTLLDKDVGRIVTLVDSLGLSKETIIIFTSDNGPHAEGGHDWKYFQSNGELRGIKRDLYEGGIRVPFIARWTGHILPGTVNETPLAFWDFLPTACDVAGLPAPGLTDGISFLPALLGRSQPEHNILYWEFNEQGGKQAVINGNWKAVRLHLFSGNRTDIELYNLDTDPEEKNNVAVEHPEIVEEMRVIMDAQHREDPEWPFYQRRN